MAASKTSRTREVSSLVQCPHNQGTRAPRTSEPALRTENRTERVLLSACRLFRAGPGEWQSEWTGFRHRQGPVGGMRAGAELGIPRSLVRGAAQSRHLSVRASLASPALGRNWRKWPRGAWRLQT